MKIGDKIRYKKLQYDINREAAKISAVSSGKTDKYEYLTGEEILPPNQSTIIEHAKFTYSLLGNTSENKFKKQVDASKSINLSYKIDELKQVESVFPKNHLSDLLIDKLKKIIQLQNNIKLDDLECTTKKKKML